LGGAPHGKKAHLQTTNRRKKKRSSRKGGEGRPSVSSFEKGEKRPSGCRPNRLKTKFLTAAT